jgi:hypothetical protein
MQDTRLDRRDAAAACTARHRNRRISVRVSNRARTCVCSQAHEPASCIALMSSLRSWLSTATTPCSPWMARTGKCERVCVCMKVVQTREAHPRSKAPQNRPPDEHCTSPERKRLRSRPRQHQPTEQRHTGMNPPSGRRCRDGSHRRHRPRSARGLPPQSPGAHQSAEDELDVARVAGTERRAPSPRRRPAGVRRGWTPI